MVGNFYVTLKAAVVEHPGGDFQGALVAGVDAVLEPVANAAQADALPPRATLDVVLRTFPSSDHGCKQKRGSWKSTNWKSRISVCLAEVGILEGQVSNKGIFYVLLFELENGRRNFSKISDSFLRCQKRTKKHFSKVLVNTYESQANKTALVIVNHIYSRNG